MRKKETALPLFEVGVSPFAMFFPQRAPEDDDDMRSSGSLFILFTANTYKSSTRTTPSDAFHFLVSLTSGLF